MIADILRGIKERVSEKGFVIQEYNEAKDTLDADKELALRVDSVDTLNTVKANGGAGIFGFRVLIDFKVRKYGGSEIEGEIDRSEALSDVIKSVLVTDDQDNGGEHEFIGATSLNGDTFLGMRCEFRVLVSQKIY
jgi:hypothetical protein